MDVLHHSVALGQSPAARELVSFRLLISMFHRYRAIKLLTRLYITNNPFLDLSPFKTLYFSIKLSVKNQPDFLHPLHVYISLFFLRRSFEL